MKTSLFTISMLWLLILLSLPVSAQLYAPGGIVADDSDNAHVGIVTPNPQVSLHIGQNQLTNEQVYTAPGTPYEPNITPTLEGLYLQAYINNADDFKRYSDFASVGFHNLSAGGSVIRFLTNDFNDSKVQERMRIERNGSVAIGTINTPSMLNLNGGAYKLYVGGGILTEEVKVEIGWADYVFAPDYALMPLGAVKQFIQTNGHLPNTPSAQTIAQQGGVELGNATVKQQEKIEEIFLHLINMQEQIEQLKAENEALKRQLSKIPEAKSQKSD